MFMSTKLSPLERLNCAICGLQTDVSLNIAYAKSRVAARKKGCYIARVVESEETALLALNEYTVPDESLNLSED